MPAKKTTYKDIITDVKNKKFEPVYLLHGNESYYIDNVSDYIASNAITKEAEDFNLTVMYATRETQLSNIISSVKRYPMMSDRQVVILREAQNFQHFDGLLDYLKNPMKTTVFIICYKNGLMTKSKFVAAVEKVGTVMESNKLKENKLPEFIISYLKRKGCGIDPKAAQMLADFIGADLSRMSGELDKLLLSIGGNNGQKMITPDIVERNVGISKEFNNFELRDAIVRKDVLKANRIIKYFEKNPKDNPPIVSVAMLYNFFANLMLAYYAPDKSDRGLAEQMGLKNVWAVKDYQTAMRNYTAMKTMLIIGKLRDTDSKLKGFQTGAETPGMLMSELVFFILH